MRNASPFGEDHILCITDVAQLLSCSVPEATAFLEGAGVPALHLPSGSVRFLTSSVLEAIRGELKPYKNEAPKAETEKSTSENDALPHRKMFEVQLVTRSA